MIFPLVQFVITPLMMGNILMAIMFGVIWVSLFYFVAYLLQHPQLLAAAKDEFTALIFSAILIGLFVFINFIATQFIFALLADTAGNLNIDLQNNDNVQSHFDLAYASLDVLMTKLVHLYGVLYLFDVLIGFLSTLSFPLGSPLPSIGIITFSFMPFDGLVLLVNAHTMIVEAIGNLITIIWAKQLILIFSRDALIALILPFGIVMRAFPWLRIAGSSLIALSFTLYFVYPLSVIFSNYLMFDLFKPADFVYSPDQSMISFTNYGNINDPMGNMQQLRDRSEGVVNRFGEDTTLVQGRIDCSDFSASIGTWF